MPNFTVLSAERGPEKDTEWGKKAGIKMRLQNGPEELNAEWWTNAATPLPGVGSQQEFEIEDGPYGKKAKRPRGSGGFGGGGRSPRDSGRIERQHSQEMALRAVDIFTTEGWREDDLKKKVKEWTDWFVADLDNAPTQSSNGGSGAAAGGSSPDVTDGRESVPSAVPSAAAKPMSEPQSKLIDDLLNRAKVDIENRNSIMAWAQEALTGGSASAAIDGLQSKSTDIRDNTVGRLILAAHQWAKSQSDVPGDETDLPTLDGEYAEEQMAVGEAEDSIPF